MENVGAADASVQEQGQQEFKGLGIESYKKMFRRAEEQHTEARKLAHRDRDWHDNFDDSQWDDDEKRILKARRQPIVSSNRIKRKIGFLCGMEQRQRSDPKAFPRNPQDQNAATIVTDVLDFVETETRFDNIASQCFRDLNIEGIEAVEVIIENGDRVSVNQLQFDGFFYDPRSKKRDFSDAKYLGYQDWFDEDEAIQMAIAMGLDEEQAKKLIEGAFDEDAQDEGYEDKPWCMWGDADRKRVRIACMYWKDGKGIWNYVYYTGAGVMKEGVSIYLDDERSEQWPQGKPDCAIIATSANITRKNERYGSVRDMISPQSEMNYRRSAALFAIKQKRMWERPGILPKDAQETVNRSDGKLTVHGEMGKDWGFLDNQQDIANNFELLQESKAEIDVQGPNAGLQGRGTEDQSGRAIIAQQQSGMTEENDVFDTHNDFKLRVYRAMWNRCKQFWTEPKFIRVTDDENAFRFIHINQQQPVIDPATGQPAIGPDGQPMMQMVPGTQIAQMDADIILEAAPDSPTLQHEQFMQLTDMAGKGVPIPPDVLISYSQIKDKAKLAKRVEEQTSAQAKLQQAAQQMQEMQKVIEQLQKQLQQAQQTPVQKPPTVLDMIKARTEEVKQGQIEAQTQHTRAQTAQIAKEIATPAEGPEPLTPMDLADVEHKRAQTAKTYADIDVSRATAYKAVKEADRPPPKAGNGKANRA